jgi:glycosyltransferase involved in cell wall biosynthesis
MKIGIQGWYLCQPFTGIGQHTLGLTKELAKDKKISLIIPVPKKVTISGIQKKYIKVLRAKWWLLHPSLKKWYWERFQVPSFFGAENPDWEYYPYPSPLPRFSPNDRAMTVHDVILWNDKRYAAGKIKSYYHKQTRRALVRADHIFTVSQSTHDELDIPAATLLPNAIAEIPAKLSKKSYENTLVYLGGYDIRKNVPELVTAFSKLRKKHPEMQLLLVGKAHHNSKFYPKIPETEGVQKLGALSDKALYSTLKSAFAFLHASDSEGFNIPLLQAMKIGTPAIVRDIAVNREVSDGSALFMKGSLTKALSDKIVLLKNTKKRRAIIAAQKKAASKFSWNKTAKIFLKNLKHDSRR